MFDNTMDNSPATEKPKSNPGEFMQRFMQAQQMQPGGAKSGQFGQSGGAQGPGGPPPIAGVAGRASAGNQPMGMPGQPKPMGMDMGKGQEAPMPPQGDMMNQMMGKPDPRRMGLPKKPLPYSWS